MRCESLWTCTRTSKATFAMNKGAHFALLPRHSLFSDLRCRIFTTGKWDCVLRMVNLWNLDSSLWATSFSFTNILSTTFAGTRESRTSLRKLEHFPNAFVFDLFRWRIFPDFAWRCFLPGQWRYVAQICAQHESLFKIFLVKRNAYLAFTFKDFSYHPRKVLSA